MLIGFLLVLAGFLLGAGLCTLIALQVFGVLHEEAVRVVDTHLGGMGLPATCRLYDGMDRPLPRASSNA